MTENHDSQFTEDLRVLILAPTQRDASITGQILEREKIPFFICPSMQAVCSEMEKGAGAAIITEESILADVNNLIQDTINKQPAWSDFPLLVLTRAGEPSLEARKKTNTIPHITLIRRPVQVAELISTIRSCLRDRARQYEVRQYLLERERQAEELIFERDNAHTANLAKSEFLANMSHEIRTPMNAIIGLSHILSLSNPLSDKQREYLKTLRMSADTLLALINDLLDISKIEAHSIELEKIPFSLTTLVEEMAHVFSIQANQKNIRFITDVNFPPETRFMGDPTRLRQIVLNLCSNAVKFTSQGSITFSVISDAMDEPGKHLVTLEVRDTGIGIPPDKLDTVFQKFVQADSSINRKYGGSGLGLAITKTLTEMMGGTIEVESNPGQGSVFRVKLVMDDAQKADIDGFASASSSDAAPTASETPAQGHILLVEDYEPNVLVAGTFLEEFGYTYDVASDGEEALRKLESKAYAAVLMDVQMPKMNGLDATQSIRLREKDGNLPHLPIIGMTAHALAGDRERCIEAGMDDYICKPFVPDEMKEKLDLYSASGRAA